MGYEQQFFSKAPVVKASGASVVDDASCPARLQACEQRRLSRWIRSRQQLNERIEEGSNHKVGFLSEANYNSVHTMLSSKVVPEIYKDTSQLYNAVENGEVLAGLISGVPDESRFSRFSTDLISPRSFQMKPGADSVDLTKAVDAAVVRTHNAAELLKAQEANPPFQAVEVHTCRADDPAKVPFPDPATATGLLQDVLQKKRLRILAYGDADDKPDWHADGNYTVDPPTGFWPDYLNFWMAHFQEAYGTDIELERVWMTSGGTDMVLNGTIHMTEPYYIYENLWQDRVKKWSHEFSCVVMGYEQQFFVPKPKIDFSDAGGACELQLEACEQDTLVSSLAAQSSFVEIVA